MQRRPSDGGRQQSSRDRRGLAVATLAVAVLGVALAFLAGGAEAGPMSLAEEPAPTCGPAPVPGCQAWRAPATGPWSEAIDVSPDGHVTVAVGSHSIHGLADVHDDEDVWVAAYETTTGAVLWNTTYNYPGGSEVAQDVSIGPDGERVYLAGGTGEWWTPTDMLMVAYDLDSGEQLWTDRVVGRGYGGGAADVLAAPDGEQVYVSGELEGITTVAYDAETGERRWQANADSYDNPNNRLYPNVPTMDLSPDGQRLYVTAMAAYGCSCDWQTIAYDTGTGASDWTAQHEIRGGRLTYSDVPAEVRATPDGEHVIVAGTAYSYPKLIKLHASNGTELWHAGDTIRDFVRDMELGPDGERAYTASGGYALTAYDVTGDDWAVRDLYRNGYTPPDAEGSVPYDLEVSADGERVYMTGESGTGGIENPVTDYWDLVDPHTDATTVAFDADDGQQAWVARANDNPQGNSELDSYDSGRDLVVGPDGLRVHVAGTSSTLTPVRSVHTDPVGVTPTPSP